jgi:urease accessory protein
MIVANKLVKKGERTGQAAFDSITLDSDGRHRRRIRITSDGGRDVLIDLPEVSSMHHGDALESGEGLIEIRAAPEPLLEIRAHDPHNLTRIAWHLGNRHTAAELTREALYICTDHVLEELVLRLGGTVSHVLRPFTPEGGAYHYDHDHGH